MNYIGIILSIIDSSLHLIEKISANKIKSKIKELSDTYAKEINKPHNEIDDALIFSIERELRDIVQLYSTEAGKSNAKD